MDGKIIETLSLLAGSLRSVPGDWVIIGTASLYLQGYQVTPNDIDILCNSDTALRIGDILKPYHVPFITEIKRDKFNSLFSRYEINGITVEVMGDLKVNIGGRWINLLEEIENVDMVPLDGHFFKVPSRVDQIKIYQLFGREKDRRILAILS